MAAFLVAIEDCSLEAVLKACETFAAGMVSGYNNDFPPSAARLGALAREIDADLYEDRMNALPRYNGVLSINYGHGDIDCRGLTIAEQDKIDDAKGVLNGRNMALLPRSELKAALSGNLLAGKPHVAKLRKSG